MNLANRKQRSIYATATVKKVIRKQQGRIEMYLIV